jgi:hypothetical protein
MAAAAAVQMVQTAAVQLAAQGMEVQVVQEAGVQLLVQVQAVQLARWAVQAAAGHLATQAAAVQAVAIQLAVQHRWSS